MIYKNKLNYAALVMLVCKAIEHVFPFDLSVKEVRYL